MLRAVIDCNVFVSSLLGPSCQPILDAFLDGDFQLVTSKDLFDELKSVLTRSHIAVKIPKAKRGRFISLIKKLAVFVKSPAVVRVCRDPDDDALLGAALDHTDVIVTFDTDLFAVTPFKNLEIISPKEFIKRLQ